MTETRQALDFEKPIIELDNQIEELRRLGVPSLGPEIRKLVRKAEKLQQRIFAELRPWQIVQLSRHPQRPFSSDYFGRLFSEFFELHGDRTFGDDGAIVGGLGRFEGLPVVVIGHQKGRGTKENLKRNFGMPRPEGYRKARRLMELAERFERPIVTFIDTPGAYPGIDAEERGQAEAIAKNLEVMARLGVPIVAVVIGEGGSGGALALGVADRILMLEYSIYSVISPEGCASILWKDQKEVETAADQLRLTARDLARLGVADEVIAEPAGGAHRDHDAAAVAVGDALRRHLAELIGLPPAVRLERRYEKYRQMGAFLQLD